MLLVKKILLEEPLKFALSSWTCPSKGTFGYSEVVQKAITDALEAKQNGKIFLGAVAIFLKRSILGRALEKRLNATTMLGQAKHVTSESDAACGSSIFGDSTLDTPKRFFQSNPLRLECGIVWIIVLRKVYFCHYTI